jgi:hypothetical protein
MASHHYSLASRYGVVSAGAPLAIIYLLPVIAAIRHVKSDHDRWIALLWVVAAFDLLVVPSESCNAVGFGPEGVLCGVAAVAGTTLAYRKRRSAKAPERL